MGSDPRIPAQRHRPVPRFHRLGLVLLPDQADLLGAARAEPADRQHGHRDHHAHAADQGAAAASGLQVLRLDGEDEGIAAGNGEDQGARRR